MSFVFITKVFRSCCPAPGMCRRPWPTSRRASAIGTTSFGSRPAGTRTEHRATRGANITRPLAPLQCYVSVDIEDGYSDEPDAIADYVPLTVDSGINIGQWREKLIDPALAAAKNRCDQTT